MNDPADTPLAGFTVLFCSTSENIGRTTTIINVALILADAGLKILIVDAHPSTTRADHYLRPFLPANALQGATVSPPAPRPPDGGPGAAQVIPVGYHAAHASGTIGLLPADLAGPGAAAAIRAIGDAARSGAYDYVLVDVPSEGSGIRVDGLSALADVVVACFAPNVRAIESAAALAGRVRRGAGRPVNVIALGVRADTAFPEFLDQARAAAAERFSDLGPGGAAVYAEIPYAAEYAVIDTLAMLNEPPGRSDGLRVAYERLARTLTNGRVGALRQVTIAYTPRHRVWAEWAVAQLERYGVRADAVGMTRFAGVSAGDDSAVLVVSPAGLDEEAAARLRRMPSPGVRMVVVDDAPLPEGLGHHALLDLRGRTESEAVLALRRSLRVSGPAAGTLAGPRFPGAADHVSLPPRDIVFVGRDRAVDGLRDALLARPVAHSRFLLHGPAGIGKSEIALEYCRRFGGAYDIVWWLPAGDEQSIRAALGDLATALGIPTAADAADAVLRHLSSERSGTWLLVYDNASDQVDQLRWTPEARDRCHVIITARPAEPEQRAEASWPGQSYPSMPSGRRGRALRPGGVAERPQAEVPPFSRAESAALLRTRVPDLTDEQAEAAGSRVGHVPLLVDLAGAWIATLVARLRQDNVGPRDAVRRAVETFADAANRAQAALLAEHGATTRARVMFELALEALPGDIGGKALRRENLGGDAALRLLETFAVLSPQGTDLRLLRSGPMLALLSGPGAGLAGERLGDPLMVDVMLRTMGRYALVKADLGRPGRLVRMHPLIGELLRERMGDRLSEVVAEVRLALAAWSPADTEDESAGRIHAELERHLDALRPWEDARPPVRRWVLRQLDHILRRDDRLARDRVKIIGLLALQAWEEDSDQTLRLLNTLARVSRLRGEHRDNERYSFRALRAQRAVLGVNHPRTLLTAGSHAAALRMMGEFDEARDEERNVLREVRELFGAHHPRTGDAMHNLAISEALMGDARRALELAGERMRLRVALSGEGDLAVAQTAITMARYYRDLGMLEESHSMLSRVLSRRGIPAAQGAGPGLEVLRAESGLAVTERRLGRPFEAQERDERVLRDLRAHQGDHHLATLTCLAGLAADLDALGRHEEAARQAAACQTGLRDTLGPDHPYTVVCQVSLGAYLRNSGLLPEAAERGGPALRRLARRLGPAHPWAIAARVALANTLVLMGRTDEAAALEEAARVAFGDAGLPGHPNAALLARNIADTRARLRGESPADPLARADIDLEIPGL
ncbi:FxSxx-COOH system tetratricopeptide repeat protein [Sphaerisporangium aureirubrum]|uniref:FxSxx-COOH system tetratricopeptide repeat protein n=1 Tax=Sphaerisporangium aureirubrum TaxID=1544736 RepID=A0ABW1NTR4_9ACTN